MKFPAVSAELAVSFLRGILGSGTEVLAKSKGAQTVTADEIADAVRQRGRQRVPDQIKAELLTELRTIILKQ